MTRLGGQRVDAVLFDKDGTLVDFHATWDRALGATLEQLTADGDSLQRAAAAVGYDLERRSVDPGSPFIAETNLVVMELLEPWLDVSRFEEVLAASAAASVTPAAGADQLLDRLATASVPTAVVTNDSEWLARSQLVRIGWDRIVAVVVGYDSGHGAKPDAEPVLAALDALGVRSDRAVLVGDSSHDIEAARRAGVVSIHVGAPGPLSTRADMAVADLAELASLITSREG